MDIHVDVIAKSLCCGPITVPCAIGEGGYKVWEKKREGDGATPLGIFPLRKVYYRADRLNTPETALPCFALTPEDGWCDAVEDKHYNQFITHPYPASAERLWREDEAYDLIVILGHNDNPVVKGHGSAIFLHVARPSDTGPGYRATKGCVAIEKTALLNVLRYVNPDSCIRITVS